MTINFTNFDEEFEQSIKLVYNIAEKILSIPTDIQVNIVMVSDQVIKQMNKEYRSVDKVTDVLSFPMLESFEEISKECDAFTGEVNIGDIYICNSRAIEQAKEFGHSVKREICFLATHGLLHLLGYDHIDQNDEKVMFALQDEILNQAKILR